MALGLGAAPPWRGVGERVGPSGPGSELRQGRGPGCAAARVGARGVSARGPGWAREAHGHSSCCTRGPVTIRRKICSVRKMTGMELWPARS